MVSGSDLGQGKEEEQKKGVATEGKGKEKDTSKDRGRDKG